jgi:hypothetical protein
VEAGRGICSWGCVSASSCWRVAAGFWLLATGKEPLASSCWLLAKAQGPLILAAFVFFRITTAKILFPCANFQRPKIPEKISVYQRKSAAIFFCFLRASVGSLFQLLRVRIVCRFTFPHDIQVQVAAASSVAIGGGVCFRAGWCFGRKGAR